MTLVVCLRVNEGVVLAADSASSMVARYPDGRTDVSNVYNNANKVFNLYKGLPVGALTWGGGSIGEASISTLSKDFREQLEAQIDAASYTIMDIAQKYALFLQNAYLTAYAGSLPQDTSTGFIIAGYSTGGQRAEVYEVVLRGGMAEGPTLVPEFPAIYLAGQTEAAERLVYGVDPKFPIILRDNLGVPEAQVAPNYDRDCTSALSSTRQSSYANSRRD